MKPTLLITVLVGVLLAMIASHAQDTEKSPGYTTASSFSAVNMKPWEPMSLTIQAGKSQITIKPDGTVVLGDGVSLDEATRQFWDKVGVQFGHFHDAVIAGYEARKREEDQARDTIWPNEIWKSEYDAAMNERRKEISVETLRFGREVTLKQDIYRKSFAQKVGDKSYELGLRSDGVVVWRETKP